MTTKKVFKIPKKIGACADKLFEIKNKRLEKQKEVDVLKAEESALKEYIINTLPKSEASGVAGKVARVTVVKKVVPQIDDWDKFYKHVKKTGHFDLMQRRLSAGAIAERWDAGKEVPGVDHFNTVTVSIKKA